jgi:hypothetical protein
MTTTPAPLVTSCDLQLAHDITASCPLRCLQLSARVHNALCHHLRDPGPPLPTSSPCAAAASWTTSAA